MSLACTRVLETSELLEAILAQLPPQELLLAQRVSRRFQTAIRTSPSLQQALFFRAAPLKDPKVWNINPLLRKHFIPFFVCANGSSTDIESIELLDWTRDKSRKEAFLYKNANWRKMLVIQPPPKELHIIRFSHGQAGDSGGTAQVSFENSQGVTMDAVYDVTEAFLRHHSVSEFGLSFEDSEAGPRITLYLRSTMQCCFDEDYAMKESLKSEGASEDAQRDLKFEWLNRGRTRLNMDWTTDLTPEQGGVDGYEFQKWKRERVPISSLMSDVR